MATTRLVGTTKEAFVLSRDAAGNGPAHGSCRGVTMA